MLRHGRSRFGGRVFSLLLSMILIIGVFPVAAFADGEGGTPDPDTCEHEMEVIEITQEASCTQEGRYKLQCVICQMVMDVTVPATAHDFQITEHVEATCTHGGIETKVCSTCGLTETTTSAAISHDFWWDHDAVTSVSCTASGAAVYICADCGETSTIETPPRGHHYVPVAYQKQPTCTEPGLALYRCEYCNELDPRQPDSSTDFIHRGDCSCSGAYLGQERVFISAVHFHAGRLHDL